MSGTAPRVDVLLPPVLAPVTGGERVLNASGETLLTVLKDLADRHPALALHLFDEGGAVRRNIICIHRDTVVRPRAMADTPVSDGETVVLSNALAGG